MPEALISTLPGRAHPSGLGREKEKNMSRNEILYRALSRKKRAGGHGTGRIGSTPPPSSGMGEKRKGTRSTSLY